MYLQDMDLHSQVDFNSSMQPELHYVTSILHKLQQRFEYKCTPWQPRGACGASDITNIYVHNTISDVSNGGGEQFMTSLITNCSPVTSLV
jgi:hypothetical protein